MRRRALAIAVLAVGLGGCRFGFDELSGQADASTDARTVDGGADANSQPLVDRGLISRYALDETELVGGISPTEGAIVLTVTDPASELSTVQRPTGGGLRFSTVSGNARACADAAGTRLESELVGSTTGTLEIVADIQAGDDSRSRLAGLGLDVNWSFAIGYSSIDTRLIYSMNDTVVEYGEWVVDVPARGRAVYHVVYDSEQVDAAERARLYIDGVYIDTNMGVLINTAQPLSFANSTFCIGNRRSGMRAPQGSIYYTAVYSSALTEAEIVTNAERLAADDD